MQSNDPRSPAHPEPPRQRLTSLWTLLGIAIAVGVTLVLIFPGRGLLTTTALIEQRATPGQQLRTQEQQQQQPPADPVVAQLESQAKSEPQNTAVRFKLAQRHTELNKITDARAALESLYNSPDPAVRQRARLQDFKLQMKQMYAFPAGSKEREREAERLRQELVAMSQYEWDSAGLLDLAGVAGELQARKLRSDLYLRVVRSDSNAGRGGIDDVAAKALADGEYRIAADMYFTAKSRATNPADQRYYLQQAVKAYQAGNMVREGLVAAESNLGALSTDDQTLHFMIRLARAANDMPRAQVYAKRLLRMSEQGTIRRWLVAALSFAIPSAAAAERDEAPRPKVPQGMRPYDAEDYALAYDVFLGNRNLQDAYRVARAAVDQVPNDMRWRERLAQVTEWSGKSGEAVEQWLFIARRTGSPNAWAAVLRIAPGSLNDEAVLEAMRYQAGKGTLSDQQLNAIAAVYERVGRPKEGVEFLEQEYARRPRPALLESIARLHEATGNVDGAIAAQRRLLAQSPPTTDRVTTLASLLIARGEFKEAYDLLQKYRTQAPADDVEYLRLMGDLALRMRDDTAAQVAYERLVTHPKANVDDFTRLVQLLAPRQPEAAARLAEAAHQRFNAPHLLLTALGIHSQRRDFGAMRRILAGMSPETERELVANPGFLLIRADYRAATGSPQLALADYRESLRLDPNNRFARMNLMYFLIDRRELALLRREMPAALRFAETDPEFQGVIASAWLSLDEPARAVPYFAEVVKRNPDDYLWLLNYADALERNLQSGEAWRVRRHAWVKLRQAIDKKERPPLELLRAQARMAAEFMPGDEGLAVIRNLLRQDAPLDATSLDPNRQVIDAATRELVLAWTVSTEQHIAAKVWLWTQYARGLAAPKWAEVVVALAHQDLETMQRALDQYADAIPRYDRHQAARSTQQYRLAQDIAFTELERYPTDDEMHLRLTQSTFDMVSHSQAGYTSFRRGTIGGHEWTGEMAVWLSPRLRLSFDVSDIHQGLINTAALGFVPPSDRLYGVTALWRHAIGETRFTLFHREALADHNGARVVHTYPLGTRVGSTLGLAYNERTLETSGLAAGGVRDQATIGLQYTLSKREYILGQLYGNRYYTVTDRTEIGSSYGLTWEAGHRFRTEYPDWHIRAAGSFNHFSRNGTGDAGTAVLTPTGTVPTASFFLPPSFSNVGLYTGFGTYYQNNYTRALRPFVDVGVVHNTVTGNGYSALAGISGSLIGGDRVTLYASTGRGGSGTGDVVREIGMRYMYLFDNF